MKVQRKLNHLGPQEKKNMFDLCVNIKFASADEILTVSQ